MKAKELIRKEPRLDIAKLTRDPKPEPNDLDSYPTRHPKYAHPKGNSKPELIQTEPYLIQIFYKVACFGMTGVFDQKLVDPK